MGFFAAVGLGVWLSLRRFASSEIKNPATANIATKIKNISVTIPSLPLPNVRANDLIS